MDTPKKILLVDDDADIRAMIAAFLLPANYEITEVYDVALATRALSNGIPFDLVILDFWLGNDHAVSIMDLIASGAQDLPVIMISGGSQRMDLEKTEAISDVSGAVRFLQKPFHKSDLLEAVTSAMR